MEYKKINCNSYNIHTINTDKFKTIHIEVIFRNKVVKEKLPVYTLLTELMSFSSNKYKTRKEMNIRKEELYTIDFYCTNTKVGNVMLPTFISEFIDPKYIKDEKYIEEIFEFIFGNIMHPNVKNGEFNEKDINIVKNRMKFDIDSIEENPDRKSMMAALSCFDSSTSYNIMGTKEELDDITSENLYKAYRDLFEHFLCDIFIIGDIKEEYITLIKNKVKNKVIKEKKVDFLVDNKMRKSPLIKKEESNFNLSNLIMAFNIELEDNQKNNFNFRLFNSILCSSGLSSILYQELREKNSLCYGVRSLFLKYDRLLIIQVGLDKKDIDKAKNMIIDCIKNIAKGKLVSEELFNNNKQVVKTVIENSVDDNVSILNNYVFNYFVGIPLYEEKKRLLKEVKIEDIYKCARSLKLNMVYTLVSGEDNE